MTEPEHERVQCASYTHARRHPMVLGRIGGWAPPFQLTVTQLVVLLTSFGVLLWTWSLWSVLAPGSSSLMVCVGLPVAAAWAVRRVRLEGRSIARTALGYVQLASRPRGGALHGRPARNVRPARWDDHRIFVGEARARALR